MLVDGERLEQPAPLRDVADPRAGHLVGGLAEQLPSVEPHRAGRPAEQAGDRQAQGRLAHAVAADQGYGLGAHAEADSLQDVSGPVVAVEVLHRQQRLAPAWLPRYRACTVSLARISEGVPSTMIRPSCIIVTHSATRSATSMSCSIRISVTDGSSPSSISVRVTRSARERPAAGSSSIMSLGSAARAIPTSSCRCSPCDSSATITSSRSPRPTASAIARALSRMSASALVFTSRVGPQDRPPLTGADRQVDVGHGHHAAEPPADPPQVEDRLGALGGCCYGGHQLPKETSSALPTHAGASPFSHCGFSRSGAGVSALKNPPNLWSTSGIRRNVWTSATPSPVLSLTIRFRKTLLIA